MGSSLWNLGIGQLTSALDFQREKKKMQIQQDYALEQMAQSQAYNLENMEKQNEYQIAAENRANEYNSASAQVERARLAGISPTAAIGAGGAGGLMSASSSPSSSTPSPSGSPSGGVSRSSVSLADFSRAAQIGADIALSSSQKANVDQDTKLKEQETINLEIQNQFEASIRQAQLDGYKLSNAGIGIDNQIKEFNRRIAEVTAANEPEKQQAALKQTLATIAQITASIENDKTITAARKKELEANAQSLMAAAVSAGAQAKLYGAQTMLTAKQAEHEGIKIMLTASETERVQMLTKLGYQEVEAQRIANEFNEASNKFKVEHMESDRNWEKAAAAINMGQAVVSTVCGAIGCAVSGGFIQPPASTVTTVTKEYDDYNKKWIPKEKTVKKTSGRKVP